MDTQLIIMSVCVGGGCALACMWCAAVEVRIPLRCLSLLLYLVL